MTLSYATEKLLGVATTASRTLAAGVFAVELADGRTVVAKRPAGPRAHAAEAAGLRWLASSGDVPVPAVYAADDDWLLIEHLPPAQPSTAAAEAFGRGLAALHLRGAEAFGSPPPGGPVDAWIGLAPMRNSTAADWPSFYAAQRLEPYLRGARDQGVLSAEQAAVIEQVCERLSELAGPPEPPARLHGDAWSGNLHWCAEGVALLDPAAHGGHRETDLAMMRLFGAPLLPQVLGAYAEAAADAGAPLTDGWPDRVGLHQLFPLLVHTVLFGGGYAQQTVAAARSALRAGG